MVESKFEKYKRAIATVAAAVVSAIIILFLFIMPSFKSIGKNNKELTEKKAKLAAMNQKLEKLKELKVKENELKAQEAVVEKAIPSKKDVGDLFIQLEGLMTEAGGSTTGITENGGTTVSPNAGSAQNSASTSQIEGVNIGSYNSSVKFSSYENFKQFLQSSENSQRYIQLDTFKVDESGTKSSTFSVGLVYKAYYRGSQTASAATNQPGSHN